MKAIYKVSELQHKLTVYYLYPSEKYQLGLLFGVFLGGGAGGGDVFVSHLTIFYLQQETRVTVRSGYRVSQTTEENNKYTDSKPLESEKGNVASTKTKSIIFL